MSLPFLKLIINENLVQLALRRPAQAAIAILAGRQKLKIEK